MASGTAKLLEATKCRRYAIGHNIFSQDLRQGKARFTGRNETGKLLEEIRSEMVQLELADALEEQRREQELAAEAGL